LGSSRFGASRLADLPDAPSTRKPGIAPCRMILMKRAAVCVAIALVAGARGHISSEAWEYHITFPLRGPLGNSLKPSLLQGVDMFKAGVAKQIRRNATMDGEQWEEEDFLEHNRITSSQNFCCSIRSDASHSRLLGNEDEELFYGINCHFADGNTLIAASKVGHVKGHLCCVGTPPTQTQLTMTKCQQTSTMLKSDGPRALEQALEGESLVEATIDADGSSMTASVKEHVHPGLMRSAKPRPMSSAAQSDAEANDPGIFPAQIFKASLHDGLDSGSLDLAVEQVAHLARASSGLVVVDKRLFGKLMKKLGSHSAGLRVVGGRDGGLMFFWR